MTEVRGEGESRGPVITIDGPAGSGKSTTAREVARRLGFRHLDSGALYRALTVALLEAGIPEEEWEKLDVSDLDRFHIRLQPRESDFLIYLGDRPLEAELRTPQVTALVSPLSALPAVRGWLLSRQREAGAFGSLVADGRDMGTVVFLDAQVKVYLVADLSERARRRFLEREQRDPTAGENSEEEELIRIRDKRDSERSHAPLTQPEDALLLDTTDLAFDQQVQAILDYVRHLTLT
jgi:cytidylate kinase